MEHITYVGLLQGRLGPEAAAARGEPKTNLQLAESPGVRQN